MKKGRKSKPSCSRCAQLERELARERKARQALEAKVAELEAVIREIQSRLGTNSQNSSLPPSRDPLEAPPRPKNSPSGRKRGGQPGHGGAQRELLPISEVDHVVEHRPTKCDHCDAKLPAHSAPEDPPPIRHQVYELPEKLYEVTEHQAHACACPKCGKVTRETLPADVAESCFGSRLVSFLAFLTGACHVSRRNAQETATDVLGIPIALGSVSNLEAEVSEALAEPYTEAAQEVQNARTKNVDETGYKNENKRCWLWVAATAAVAVFCIHKRRNREGLGALLGESIKGILTSDRFSVYSKIRNELRQVCWAHLKRDFKKLVDRGEKGATIGQEGLDVVEAVFLRWGAFKCGLIPTRAMLQLLLEPCRQTLRASLEKGRQLGDKKTATFCSNLLSLESALWTFTLEENVEPTNNHAERLLRSGVLWRKRSLGAQSERGCRYIERVLTAVQTLRLQRRPVFAYLAQAVEARRSGAAAPSLLSA